MSRRSPPQRDIDDRAFPIRVKTAVPRDGLGNELTRVLTWLQTEIGPGDYAQHPGRTLGGDAAAFHFRHIEDEAYTELKT